MKKRYLFLLIILSFVLIPLNIKAATLNELDISCPASVKKNASFNCTISGEVDSQISSLTGSVTSDDTRFTVNDSSFTAEVTSKNGSYLFSTTIGVTAKDITGSASITVSNVSLDGSEASKTATTQVRVLDNDASLKAINIDGALINGFKSTTRNYNLTINKKAINITANANSSAASVSGAGSKNLVCGSNKVNIIGIAEDDSKETYTLNITRNCNKDTTLKGIKVSNGELSPKFASNIKSYNVDVSSDVEVITISATKNDSTQTVEGTVSNKRLNYGENEVKIVVTSENGDKGTYTITINRKDDRSNDVKLKSLTLSDGKLKFDPDVTEYKTKVLYDVTSIKIEAVAKSDKAKVEITGGNNLVVGENTITIKVTAENEKDTSEYKIIVTRLKEGEDLGDNAYLKSLKVSGYDINFDKEKFKYNLKIDNEKSLDIDAVMEDSNARSVRIVGNKNLKNGSIIKIITTSADGETSLTYELHIEKSNLLFIILIAGGSILLAAIILIVFIVKNNKKKHKPEIKDKEIRNKDLINRVNEQLEDEKEETIEFNNSTLKERIREVPANQDILLKINKMNEEKKLTAREELRKEQLEEDDIYSSILKGTPVKTTKICTICGHKVDINADVCPYCKRIF